MAGPQQGDQRNQEPRLSLPQRGLLPNHRRRYHQATAYAVRNWQDPSHKAKRPNFHKKRLTGTGSLRAAGAVLEIRYNGRRRIHHPYLGSVKLRHTLPEGNIHEAHIRCKNGQWLLSIKYWKPPEDSPDPVHARIPAGAVDTGIHPHATDSEAQTWRISIGLLPSRTQGRPMATRPSTQAASFPGLVESPTPHRQTPSPHQRAPQKHHPPDDLRPRPQVPAPRNRRPPRHRPDAGPDPEGPSRRLHGRAATVQLTYKGQWHHCHITLAPRFDPASKTCSNCSFVNAKLKRERFWQCPVCGVNHERNINPAMNLRGRALPPALSGRYAPRQASSGRRITPR